MRKDSPPWKEQAAAKIRKEFHPGRGKDDPGPRAELILELLDREETEHLVDQLTRLNNGKRFTRYDTDEAGGIDLPEILGICAFWGKYALRSSSQRSDEYDLQQIEKSYEATTDPKIRDDCFRETMTIAKLLAAPRPKGRRKDHLKTYLIRELYNHLRKRFGDRPSYEKLSKIIEESLGLVRMGIDPVSVRKRIQRDAKLAEDERGALERERRLYKAERRTGSPYGRKIKG